MSLIDDIKADLEAGTPGPWMIKAKAKSMTISGNIHQVANHEDFPSAFVPAWDAPEMGEEDGTVEALTNARRIARVPDLEAALLAAGELAEMLDNASSPWVWGSGQDIDWRHKRDATLAAFRRAIGEAQ